MLAGGIVVDDEMDAELLRNGLLDMAKEREKLLVAMPVLALSDHATGGDIQRSKEGRRSMADVVVRDPFDIAQTEWQQGLGPIQRLDLALLIDAQDDRVVGGDTVKDTSGRPRGMGSLLFPEDSLLLGRYILKMFLGQGTR